MRRLQIDYSQPPVIVGTPVPINGEWINGNAVFTNFRFGQINGPVRVWAWAEGGAAVPIDVNIDNGAVMPADTITVLDIDWEL
jgi:hypothetical protein